MFSPNNKHKQMDFFSTCNNMPETKIKKLQSSEYQAFRELIFESINEQMFKNLYSDLPSRSNAPCNCMFSSLILIHTKNWTFQEFFDNLHFHIGVRYAVGYEDVWDKEFVYSTLFDFKRRIADYSFKTGIDLFEQFFDSFTDNHIQQLKIKTDIQRTDSFLVNTNIKNFSRIELLIEGIIRLYRILSDADKQNYNEKFKPYIKQTSGQFCYKLRAEDLNGRLSELSIFYHWACTELLKRYSDFTVFKRIQRLYIEHFTVVKDKVTVKENKELNSSCMQALDDDEATFRTKRKENYKGYSVNATETANPENEINLVTDVSVYTNNTDDSKILTDRIDTMKEKTPDLDELHTDGGYGSEKNDLKLDDLGINHVQTAIKGIEKEIEIAIEQIGENEYKVKCPRQTVEASPTKKRFKAVFDQEKCASCPFLDQCKLQTTKLGRVYYFNHSNYLQYKRKQNIKKIPPERRNLRPNAESMVNNFKVNLNGGKMRYRGMFNAKM